jgi:hypothetical protein
MDEWSPPPGYFDDGAMCAEPRAVSHRPVAARRPKPLMALAQQCVCHQAAPIYNNNQVIILIFIIMLVLQALLLGKMFSNPHGYYMHGYRSSD